MSWKICWCSGEVVEFWGKYGVETCICSSISIVSLLCSFLIFLSELTYMYVWLCDVVTYVKYYKVICCWCRSDILNTVVAVTKTAVAKTAVVKILSCGCWYIRARRAVSSAKLVASCVTCARTLAWKSKCTPRVVQCRPTASCVWPARWRTWSSVSSTSWKCWEPWVANSINITFDLILTIFTGLVVIVVNWCYTPAERRWLLIVWSLSQKQLSSQP